mmetsp:Transcript_17331/g.31816  ORF Transcript_17331/g.31816 Transcript_17331/m.31816 type:complete len:821 (-) Transcript_17331:47-2509(-)
MANPANDPTWMASLGDFSEGLRAPVASDKLWKEECAFSFETAESADDGLFINMSTFQAYSSKFVPLDHDRTGCMLYMYVKHSREEPEAEHEDKDKDIEDVEPTKLAIGVDGGFSAPDQIGGKGTLVKEYGFAIYPDLENILPYPTDAVLPQRLLQVADAIIAMDDASTKLEVQAWDAAEEPRPVSKFAKDLPQIENPPKISPDPKTWKCADSGQTENLWLNLSTGYIGSGRRNWDGSGGTGAALRHFEETGRKYPLCVKLGTITPDGTADVYSYDPSEDGMVTDPYLAEHLARFGIQVSSLEKTEKTMLEMDIELNKSINFAAVLEGDEVLTACYGPDAVGLYNLGNSCYVNSVLQVLFSLDPFKERFLCGPEAEKGDARKQAFLHSPGEPQLDIGTQMYKLAAALSDPFGVGLKRDGSEDDVLAVPPKMLKDALGLGHVDFSGYEQQDAREYFTHVVDVLARMDKTRKLDDANPGKWFNFLTEDRTTCNQSGKVGRVRTVGSTLMLKVPVDEAAVSKDKKELPVVTFDQCLAASLGESAAETVDDYLSPVTGQRGTATKTTQMASLPAFLAVGLRRYVVGDNWQPKKIECKVSVPREVDVSSFRTNEPPPEAEEFVPNPQMLEQLAAMGYSANGCKRALVAVNNAGFEQAVEWCMNHSEDADFNKPLETSAATGGTTSSADPDSVAMLASMGFENNAAELALTECKGNIEQAADWLFSHSHEIDSLLAEAQQNSKSSLSEEDFVMQSNDSSSGRYYLRAFISHIGKTVTGGHYLCHINQSQDLRDASLDKWVIYNDRKVALSKNTPFDHGYLYFFERAS